MVRWPFFEPSPFRDLMDSALREERRRRASRGEPMPVNVSEEPGALVVEAMIPGVEPDGVEIQGGEGVLTIRARSRVPEREYLHQEIHPVEWLRQLALPPDCRVEEAEASAENGILTIRIPKSRPKPPEKIRIQVQRRGGEAQTIEAKPGSGYSEVPQRKPPPRTVRKDRKGQG